MELESIPWCSRYGTSTNQQSNANCTQTLCDHPKVGTNSNIQGFSANLAQPTTSKFAVGRLDHDFSAKWHFMSSYRWFKLKAAADAQVDIGGFFPGDTLGTPASQSSLPQQAFLWTAGLTTNVTTNTTNDLHYSFLRNFWQWQRTGDHRRRRPRWAERLKSIAASQPASGKFMISGPTT